jgi:hypothetical protein
LQYRLDVSGPDRILQLHFAYQLYYFKDTYFINL